MSCDRHIGLERRDGLDVGRDPRSISWDELEQLGHAQGSPLRALLLKCLDCCNESAQEVRLCTAVDCPSWPFRMGSNPWRVPLDANDRARRAATLSRNRASALTSPEKTREQIGASRSHGVRMPSDRAVDFPPAEKDEDEGGAS